jgi:putative iron-regulated protein
MKHLILAASLLALLPATHNAFAQSKQAKPATASAAVNAASLNAVATHYGAVVHASYSDALDSAMTMQQAIATFVKSPSAANLEASRKAWLAAREWYGQTEAFRFYSGPIDDKNGPEGNLNAWPIDESYIDGVKDKPSSGLINNKKFAINKKNLSAQNERGGEENIATGWHAIEFLLWGQDLSATGPGERGFEDYVDGKAPNADRRRQYLGTVTELLVDDLRFLVNAWAPNSKNNYRAKFEKDGRESVRKIIVGLGSLSRGELAGQRLEVALNSQDQEDEHSCFSDNTHRDIVNNAKGVQNVWLGEYKRADGSMVKGASLRDVVATLDAALAEKTSQQISASVASAEAIQAPFDREIAGDKAAPGRSRIQKTIDSLTLQSQNLVTAANVVGISKLTLVNPK